MPRSRAAWDGTGYFPPPYAGSDEDVRAVTAKVAGFMGVPARMDVRFSSDLAYVHDLAGQVPGGRTEISGTAGHCSGADARGQHVITIDGRT